MRYVFIAIFAFYLRCTYNIYCLVIFKFFFSNMMIIKKNPEILNDFNEDTGKDHFSKTKIDLSDQATSTKSSLKVF